MIDWNGDGRVDPTEVVLTDIILSEQPESSLDTEPESVPAERKRESWLKRLFQKRGWNEK